MAAADESAATALDAAFAAALVREFGIPDSERTVEQAQTREPLPKLEVFSEFEGWHGLEELLASGAELRVRLPLRERPPTTLAKGEKLSAVHLTNAKLFFEHHHAKSGALEAALLQLESAGLVVEDRQPSYLQPETSHTDATGKPVHAKIRTFLADRVILRTAAPLPRTAQRLGVTSQLHTSGSGSEPALSSSER